MGVCKLPCTRFAQHLVRGQRHECIVNRGKHRGVVAPTASEMVRGCGDVGNTPSVRCQIPAPNHASNGVVHLRRCHVERSIWFVTYSPPSALVHRPALLAPERRKQRRARRGAGHGHQGWMARHEAGCGHQGWVARDATVHPFTFKTGRRTWQRSCGRVSRSSRQVRAQGGGGAVQRTGSERTQCGRKGNNRTSAADACRPLLNIARQVVRCLVRLVETLEDRLVHGIVAPSLGNDCGQEDHEDQHEMHSLHGCLLTVNLRCGGGVGGTKEKHDRQRHKHTP